MKKANDSVKVICYGQERIWDNREDAIAFYLEGVLECAGSEQRRYANIYSQLIGGCKVCTDCAIAW